MPEHLAADAARADKDLDDLKNGLIKLSRAAGSAQPPINQPAKIVDFDPCGTGISRKGFRGFT